MKDKSGKMNLALIARKCGLSKMTVSRALRRQTNVAPETRDQVMRIAEKMGFVPRSRKSATTQTTTGHFYILFKREYSIHDAYFSGIILTIQRELFDRGHGCSFGTINDDFSDFLKLSAMLKSQDPAGVFVVGDILPRYADTLLADFRHGIFIDFPGSPLINRPYNSVSVDHVHGGHQGVSHLLGLNRRRILLIVGRADHYFSRDLLQAYRETLTENQIEFDPSLVLYGDHHVQSGYEVTKAALAAGLKFDAVFSNDEMACGAMRAIQEAGRTVPAEISVLGFDGLPAGELVTPRLSTVAIDREKMGRLAVRRLLALMQDETEEPFEKTTLFPQLLIRESCGKNMSEKKEQ